VAFWRVEFTKKAYKTYKKLLRGYQKKIDQVLTFLVTKERIIDIRPVEGQKDIYRIRVGKYRMLIKIREDQSLIIVVKIGLRGKIYKNKGM